MRKKLVLLAVLALALIAAACGEGPRIIGEIQTSVQSANEVAIQFRTAADATSRVAYGVNGEYTASTAEQTGREHTHIIPVEAFKDYNFTVHVSDATGELVSDEIKFTLIVHDEFEGNLADFWTIYNNNDNARVAVIDGKLQIDGFHKNGTDNNQKGIVSAQPLNLAGRTTVIEIDYVVANHMEQNPGFAGEIIQGDDVWWHNGFRLTGYGDSFNTSMFNGGDGSIGGMNIGDLELPYTLTWILKHEKDKEFTIEVKINGVSRHVGPLNIGSLNPEALYFYLYVSNNNQDGPSVFDRVTIYQK